MNMTKSVKNERKQSGDKYINERVENFMGGGSFKLNPLETLKIVASSSIFGEPAYYRNGEFSKTDEKKIYDGMFDINKLAEELCVIDKSLNNMKTSELMEKIIDESLTYDFKSTIEFAAELRNDYYMRLNPQIIMVRAAKHPLRMEFNKNNPELFREIEKKVMLRMDEPSAQLTYWLYRYGDKNKIPSILKRSWSDKYEKGTKYELAKYKNKGLGIINTIRICHADGKKNPIINELMTTGTIIVDDDEKTWEKLKSEGNTWKQIFNKTYIPHMALLRNLRNIFSEIDDKFTCEKILEMLKKSVKSGKQFPFRYYTAKNAISIADVNFKSKILDTLDECIDISMENMPVFNGKTMCLSDNSGSAWGSFNSEYGSVTVADIANLSSVITAKNSYEGYVGVFGDKLKTIPISNRNGVLLQHEKVNREGKNVGAATENGIWLFFRDAIDKKEHWDNIFIYSDQQAGHGGLYGTSQEAKIYFNKYGVKNDGYNRYIDVIKLIEEYRKNVNNKVNIYTVQVAGYDNVLVPTNLYRTSILYGWTGKEALYADKINKFWDEFDLKHNNK